MRLASALMISVGLCLDKYLVLSVDPAVVSSVAFLLPATFIAILDLEV